MRISATAAELRSGETSSLLPWKAALNRLVEPVVRATPGLHGQVTWDRAAYSRGEARYLVPIYMPSDKQGTPKDGGKYLKCHFYQPDRHTENATGLDVRACGFAFAINIEIDGLPLDEQIRIINELPEELEPSMVSFSGNKSLHAKWTLSALASRELAAKIRERLSLLLGGDPAAKDVTFGARLPGWGGERSQPVLYVSDALYTADQLEQAAKRLMAERGIAEGATSAGPKLSETEYLPSDDPAFKGLTPGRGKRGCPWCGGQSCLYVFVTDDGILAARCFNKKCAGDKKCHTRYAEPSVTTEQARKTKRTLPAEVEALLDGPSARKAGVVTEPSGLPITTPAFLGFARQNPVDVARAAFSGFLGSLVLAEAPILDADVLDPLDPPSAEEAARLNEEAQRRYEEMLGKPGTCREGLVFSGPGATGAHVYFAAPCYKLDCKVCGVRAQAALCAPFLAVAASWSLTGEWEVGVYEATGSQQERQNLQRWEQKHQKDIIDPDGRKKLDERAARKAVIDHEAEERRTLIDLTAESKAAAKAEKKKLTVATRAQKKLVDRDTKVHRERVCYDLHTLTFMVRPGTSLTLCAWRKGVADPSPQLRKKLVVIEGQSPIEAARTITARFDLAAWAETRNTDAGKKLRYFRGRPQDLALLSALRRRLLGIKPRAEKAPDAPPSPWAPVWESPEETCAALNKVAEKRGLETYFVVNVEGGRRQIDAVGSPGFPVHDLVVEAGLEKRIHAVTPVADDDGISIEDVA